MHVEKNFILQTNEGFIVPVRNATLEQFARVSDNDFAIPPARLEKRQFGLNRDLREWPPRHRRLERHANPTMDSETRAIIRFRPAWADRPHAVLICGYSRFESPVPAGARRCPGGRYGMIAATGTLWSADFSFRPVASADVRNYAKARLAQLDQARKAGPDKAMAMAISVAAMLLFLNGGTALAIRHASSQHYDPAAGDWVFLAGVLVSVLNGWLTKTLISRQGPLLCRAHRYWTWVAKGATRSPVEEYALWHLGRNAFREGLAIPVTVLFSAGPVVWGYLCLMPR